MTLPPMAAAGALQLRRQPPGHQAHLRREHHAGQPARARRAPPALPPGRPRPRARGLARGISDCHPVMGLQKIGTIGDWWGSSVFSKSPSLVTIGYYLRSGRARTATARRSARSGTASTIPRSSSRTSAGSPHSSSQCASPSSTARSRRQCSSPWRRSYTRTPRWP